jgi:ABC-type lipoprotein export system ATPase subunit
VADLLRAEHVSKTWDPRGPAPVHAVRDVSLALAPAETLVITGPSGSGKTTLLSMLGGLLRPDAGRIELDGLDLAAAGEPERRTVRLRRIGFVFQRGLLLAHLTAAQNVALVARAAGVGRRAAHARAEQLLARLGVGARAAAYPAALSPGEQQRVALARALSMRPGLVLADEPTAHLDGATGARVTEELRALAVADGAGVVIVTHDVRLAALADRRLHLDDGRLVAAE